MLSKPQHNAAVPLCAQYATHTQDMLDPFKLHLAITAAIKVNGRDSNRDGSESGSGSGGRDSNRDGSGAEAVAGTGKCNSTYTFYYQAAKFTCVK